MAEKILFNLQVIGPIFLLVVLGFILKQVKIIDDTFVKKSSNLVFKICLPALIFEKLSVTNFNQVFDVKLILWGIAITLAQIVFSWFFAGKITNSPEDKGVFVQGSFRSNLAIIGLAVLGNVIGDEAVVKASILLAFIMPIYNITSVIILMLPHQKSLKIEYSKFAKELIKNPLVISVLISLPFSYNLLSVPHILKLFVHYLSVLALPLALLDIGATVNLKALLTASSNAFISAIFKVVLFPLFFWSISFWFGYRGIDLAIILVLAGAPTAIASFPMAAAMKGNSKLAGNIIVISTLLSVLTLSLGFVFI